MPRGGLPLVKNIDIQEWSDFLQPTILPFSASRRHNLSYPTYNDSVYRLDRHNVELNSEQFSFLYLTFY